MITPPKIQPGPRFSPTSGPKSGKSRRRAAGFSLVELLVTISIILIVVGISFPFINSLQNGSRIEAGLNTIGVASDVARQWVGPSRWATDFSTPGGGGAEYSGTAAIFCPTREIRITINDRAANSDAGLIMELEIPPKNGYEDKRNLEYISIPSGTGLAGIWRDPTNPGSYRLIAPPFALAYDEDGHLHFGDDRGLIYYDGDFSGFYNTAQTRPGGYDPTTWSREDRNRFNDTEGTFELPFEAIECVAGIIAYDLDDALGEGYDFTGGGSYVEGSPADLWFRENGRTVFFSPHTGVMLRDEGVE